jgi:hypothetical protein
MHAHLTLSEYGQFIGVTSECLTVKEAGVTKEYPLNRLKSILLTHIYTTAHFLGLVQALQLKCGGIEYYVGTTFKDLNISCIPRF